jgi:hypothetical protein
MASLSEMRTGLTVLAIQAKLAIGLLALPSGVKPLYKAKGLGMIALRWHNLANEGGLPAEAARRVARRAADRADRALVALVAAELSSGPLFEGLLTFAAHPERYAPALGADPITTRAAA